MNAVVTLSDAEISERLAKLPGWVRVGRSMTRIYRFPDFKTAMVFVNGVAALAERTRHYPDIAIHYSEVTLLLWTFSASGITAQDCDLARLIDTTLPT